MSKTPAIICLMGPTASGKTGLAIELVQQLPFEIISVDSAMVYRGMDIGTAKPTVDILKIAPHHLIDICDPAESYSAGRFTRDVLTAIDVIFKKGKIPLLVGGTMLYFHALQKGLNQLPTANPEVRLALQQQADQLGLAALHQRLSEIDPVAAARIHPHDAQRIQRALEVYEVSGKTLTELHQDELDPSQQYKMINIIVAPNDRKILHQRIAKRFDDMLAMGFIDEVKQLYARGDLNLENPSIRSVGYRQAWEYLMGRLNEAEMRERAIIATRQLAKRQFTWLRSWQDATWFDSENADLLERVKPIINMNV